MKNYISLFIGLFVFVSFSQEKYLGDGPYEQLIIRGVTLINGGVKYTVKDGIIYDAKRLLKEVKEMVDKKKDEENWELKQPGIK